MAIYMKLEGIAGDATLGTGPLPQHVNFHMIIQAVVENYKDWMSLTSVSWNITNEITTRASADADSKAAKNPKVSFVTVKKTFDSASADLVRTMCRSNTPRTCCIRFVSTEFVGRHYLEFTFKKVLLTHWSMSTDNDGTPSEEIHLNFTSFEMSYYPANPENVAQRPHRADYDVLNKS